MGIVCIASVGLITACGNNDSKDSGKDNSNTVVSKNEETKADSLFKKTFKVSLEDAIKTFETQYTDAVITSIEFVKDFGSYKYSVEGVNDSKEFELKIDSDTKETKAQEETLDQDDANGQKKRNDVLELEKIITPQEAMEKALVETKNKGEVVEWSIDQEAQRTYFEIKIKDGRNEIEVKVSANEGEILSVEKDD
ncbi:TPA: PepSY domain-containing protein [Bacillus cereus]